MEQYYMPLYNAIKNLKSNIPSSETAAQNFLNTLSPEVQEQLISAIYLGREHIHSDTLRADLEINRSYTSHLGSEIFARIIYEKGQNTVTYLEKLESCSQKSDFDLNSL